MTAAFTPEPWLRGDGDPRYGHTIYALREISSANRVRGGPPQANVFSAHIQNDNGLATPEELEADAQLMVMAPRLLAALERCEQEARDEGREWFWIATVIREATGR